LCTGKWGLCTPTEGSRMHNMQNLMTPAEVAEELRISLRKVYIMVDSGDLPAVRVGKKTLRIPRSSVDAVLAAANR